MVVKFESAHSETEGTASLNSSTSSPKRRWLSLLKPPTSPSDKSIEERYFSSDQYEYEISPRDSLFAASPQPQTQTIATTDLVITERMVPNTKRVYLIRHAESEENRRLASLTRGIKGLGSMRLPSKDDVMASMELLNVKAQLDSNVSDVGKRQVCWMFVPRLPFSV